MRLYSMSRAAYMGVAGVGHDRRGRDAGGAFYQWSHVEVMQGHELVIMVPGGVVVGDRQGRQRFRLWL